MASLGKQVKTVHITAPNNIEVPDPAKAPAFEIEVPQEVKKPSKVKQLLTKLRA